MKKVLLSIACCIVGVLTLAEPVSAKRIYLNAATGSIGGTWYVIFARLGEEVKAVHPDINIAPSPGGGTVNVRWVNTGEKEIGITYGMNSYDGIRGIGPYDKPKKNIRLIGNLFPSYLYCLVRDDGPIKSFADIGDKRLMSGKLGFGTETAFRRLLDVYGLNYGKVKANGGQITQVGWNDAAMMMKDRQIDLIAQLNVARQPQMIDVSTFVKLRILEMDREHLDKFLKNYPAFYEKNFPEKSYEGVKGGMPLPTTGTEMIVHKDIPDDVVYKITKILWENIDGWKKTIALLKESTVEAALISETPLHPGAKKYYEEIGLKK